MSEREVAELKVQAAAAWLCFDTLVSEIEHLKATTVIHIGRAVEKAKTTKIQLQKQSALASPKNIVKKPE